MWKKIIRSAVALMCCPLLLLSSFAGAAVAGEEMTGMSFTAEKQWVMSKDLTAMPNTIEVTLRLPANAVDKAGQLLGNYIYGIAGTDMNLEIFNNGQPKLHMTFADGVRHTWAFDSVDVTTGDWVHLAIVRDVQAMKMHCYLDGELGQSLALTSAQTEDIVPLSSFGLGSDMHYHNTDYFKGKIHKIALYSDARSAAQIQSDMTAMNQDGLIAYYDLSAVAANATTISDLSGNGYHVKEKIVAMNTGLWLDEGPSIRDYDYSFAVVGDQQFMTAYYPEHLDTMYDWLVDNAEAKKMKYMMNMGDITHHVSVASEWELAKKNAQKLDDIMPYCLTRGNHDGAAQMNQYFPIEDYPDEVTGYNGGAENTWRELKVGDISYLIFTLDFQPSDEVLAWAGKVIEDHPYHNVILTTHSYLISNGGRQENEGNNGEGVWNKLASQHENVVLVLSGHIEHDDIVVAQSKGVHGNTVTEMVVNPQTVDRRYWGTGTVAMFYFSNHGRNLQVEYYSTVRDQWFKAGNQKELITLDVVKSEAYLTALGEVEEQIAAFGTAEEFILSMTPENQAEKQAAFQAVQDAIAQLSQRYGEETVKEDLSNYSVYAALKNYFDQGDIDTLMAALEQVSYRDSVLDAIQTAKAVYNMLTEEQKATVDAAEAEYNRLAKVVEDMKVVWEADTRSLEGVFAQGAGLALSEDGTWLATPTGNVWSLQTGLNLDLSGYDFNKLKMEIRLKRTGGSDSYFVHEFINQAGQNMLKTRWYNEFGAKDGVWTEEDLDFTVFEDSKSTQNPWPTWTADTWKSDSPMKSYRIFQNSSAATAVEIQRVAICYDGDLQPVIDAANAVVDQIAAIGQVTEENYQEKGREIQEAKKAAAEFSDKYPKAAELVANLADLEAAEGAVDEMKAAADQAAADAVTAQIETLTEESTQEDVVAARAAYEALTEAQKALVAEVTLEKLAQWEEKFQLSPITYGDVDGNGKVDAADALKALQHAVKLITLEGDDFTAADVSGDDKIDATDALLMLQYTVKLIDKFPVEA